MSGSTTKKCAVCGKPRDTDAYRPFCSKRCSDVDLQRWLTGGYVVPGEPEEGNAPEVSRQDEEG